MLLLVFFSFSRNIRTLKKKKVYKSFYINLNSISFQHKIVKHFLLIFLEKISKSSAYVRQRWGQISVIRYPVLGRRPYFHGFSNSLAKYEPSSSIRPIPNARNFMRPITFNIPPPPLFLNFRQCNHLSKKKKKNAI